MVSAAKEEDVLSADARGIGWMVHDSHFAQISGDSGQPGRHDTLVFFSVRAGHIYLKLQR